jgi:hypothetical protein
MKNRAGTISSSKVNNFQFNPAHFLRIVRQDFYLVKILCGTAEPQICCSANLEIWKFEKLKMMGKWD